jgi:hypothetical protein
MNNHKLVTISIFGFFKHEKDAIFFYEKYAWKNFRIWPYAIKYFSLFENVLSFFFEIFRRKPGILIPDLYFIV